MMSTLAQNCPNSRAFFIFFSETFLALRLSGMHYLVYIYVCTLIYMYIYIYIYVCIYEYMYIYITMLAQNCPNSREYFIFFSETFLALRLSGMYICIYIFICIYTYACIYVHIYVYMYVYICMYRCTQKYIKE
jgi:hypothetical protein